MLQSYKRLSFKHKNPKFLYYLTNCGSLLLPSVLFQPCLKKQLRAIHLFDTDYVVDRVNYYNKLTDASILSPQSPKLSHFKLAKKHKVYFFDAHILTRYFSQRLLMSYCFGDVIHVPEQPSIVKSRPIFGNNAHSVVLKLVKIRHFLFLTDKHPFTEKKNLLIGRSKINQPHRARFMTMYFDHPLCNIGGVSKRTKYPEWLRPRLTLEEHLEYKFILCLEGNDVASNLKWVMSSNSLAVMPKPTYETWFMEGRLIPNYHYVAIKDDFSDLEDRLNYYIEHEQEALRIIENAHAYIEQFKNKKREKLIGLLVLQKYFQQTGQL